MPRLTATRDGPIRAPAPRPAPARAPAKARPKKPASPQDRLKTRTLFFRRVRRSIKPGLWVLGGVCALMLGSEVFRALPAAPVISPAGTLRHGFADAAAALGFRIADIKIQGADTTKPDAIKAALGIVPGDPILGLSLTAAVTRLEALGPVQSASIQRALPDTLIVTITERAPYAIWQTADTGGSAKFVLIDKAGNTIVNQDAAAAKRRDPDLLLLAGADAPQNAATLMAELNAEPAVLARVTAAERIDGLRWNLTLKNQTIVKLPEAGEQTAISQLATLQTSMSLLDRPVEFIDLRLPGRMVVHPYPQSTGHT